MLVEILFEILLDILLEALVELGFEKVRPKRGRSRPVLASFALFLLGGLVGLLFALAVPERLLPGRFVPVLSLIVAPLIVGVNLHWFGKWRANRGHSTTHLATFYGGAAFAFGSALARFLLLRY